MALCRTSCGSALLVDCLACKVIVETGAWEPDLWLRRRRGDSDGQQKTVDAIAPCWMLDAIDTLYTQLVHGSLRCHSLQLFGLRGSLHVCTCTLHHESVFFARYSQNRTEWVVFISSNMVVLGWLVHGSCWDGRRKKGEVECRRSIVDLRVCVPTLIEALH